MSQQTPQEPFSKKRVVYDMPGTDAVTVRRDVEFPGAEARPLAMDVYYPPDAHGARPPVAVIVLGYRDAGYQNALGCRFKEMAMCSSWARLMAASGIAVIVYTNSDPVADLQALLQWVRDHGAPLGVDGDRIGVFALSGCGPTGLSMLMRDAAVAVTCAVLAYAYTLDLDGTTGVADAAATWGFVNACAGKSVADLRREIPLFVARAGQDQFPGLNDAMDRFISSALACNLPITVSNHPQGPHAFDLFHDSETTREIVRSILSFLRFHLVPITKLPNYPITK